MLPRLRHRAGPDMLRAGPVRMVAWLPPLMWRTAGRPIAGRGGPGACLRVLAVLGWLAVRDLPRLSTVDRRQASGFAAVAFALLVLGATLAALNGDVHAIVAAGAWGRGWRDTAVTAVAGALLLVALGHLVRAWRTVGVALVVVLVLAGAASAAANKRYADRLDTSAPAVLANRVALEMAGFEHAAGNLRRCGLRAEFRTMYADSAFSLNRFDQSLDVAARQMAGVAFCSEIDR